jgi:CHAD domain-containing protein
MHSNSLQRRYQQQYQSFANHFDHIRAEGFTEEEIHRLRVDIKKIRAMLTLMELASKGRFNRKKHLKFFDRLFEHAGNLRETHVNQTILDELEQDECFGAAPLQGAIANYRDHLVLLESRAQQRLAQWLQHFKQRKLKKLNRRLKEKLAALNDNTVIESAEHFIARKAGKITRLRASLTGDRQLHKIRIHLKSMVEICQLANSMAPDGVLQKKIEHIKNLESLIGRWHDYTVLISSVSLYVGELKSKADESQQEILDALHHSAATMKGQIIAQLDEIFPDEISGGDSPG